MKKIKFKYWVENEGEKFYGPGPNELVKRIHKEGSLSRVAAKMNISYKKAWDLVQRLNMYSAESLVILKKGGSHGGGAEITPYALNVMREYEQLEQKLSELLEQENNLLKIIK